MNWFHNCKTAEEVINLYRKLAMQYHPDRGGDEETMKQVNTEYAFASSMFHRKEKPGRTEQEYSTMDDVSENIRIIILELLKLRGIKIEVCGLWVWVSGETKQHKEKLKYLGLNWAHKKMMWYYAGIPSWNRKPKSMEYIRYMYGSKIIRKEEEDAAINH